jgi:anti-sigma B factor antagonist
LKLEIQEASDTLSRVALVGRVDVHGLHQVDVDFHRATAGRGKPTVVDLSQVEFIGSLGLGMLISCAQSLHRKGAAMVLLGPRKAVEATLRAAGVDRFLPIVEDLEAARGRLGLES